MIKVEHLSKKRGRSVALTEVAFEVAGGEALGLIGRNGSGRSTLLAALATLVRPSSGRIVIDGVDAVRRPLEVRRKIAYLGHAVRLRELLTAREYLEIAASERGLETERIGAALAWTGLPEARRVHQLSVGQSQLLGLAATMVRQPLVMLLDEPFSHLDPVARRRAIVRLVRLRQAGTALVVAANRFEDLDGLCDRIAVMNRGRLPTIVATDELDPEGTEAILGALEEDGEETSTTAPQGRGRAPKG